MKLQDTPCPSCKAIGVLRIEEIFYAKPIGSFSLPGMQAKLTGSWWPVLMCSACDFTRKGRYDEDGIHVIFGNAA